MIGGVRWTLVGPLLESIDFFREYNTPSPHLLSHASPERYAESMRHTNMQLIAGFREHMLPSSCCL